MECGGGAVGSGDARSVDGLGNVLLDQLCCNPTNGGRDSHLIRGLLLGVKTACCRGNISTKLSRRPV